MVASSTQYLVLRTGTERLHASIPVQQRKEWGHSCTGEAQVRIGTPGWHYFDNDQTAYRKTLWS